MKKLAVRIIGLGLLFVGLVAWFSFSGGIAAQAEDVELVLTGVGNTKELGTDPFAAMYDSDELVREQLEILLEMERNIPVMSAELMGDEINREDFQDEMQLSVERQSEIRNELKSALSLETGALLDGFAITEHTQEEIANIIESAMEDRYIVKYKDISTVSSFSDAVSVAGLRNGLTQKTASDVSLFNSESKMLETDAGRFEVITFSAMVNPKELADQLKENGFGSQIEYMEPDFIQSYASLTGSDGYLEENNGEILSNPVINENVLNEVIVALIDTGVDVNHPALAGKLLEGWNFVEDNDILYDASNPLASAHGTHLAGIIASGTEDYPVQILPLKVFGDNGARTSDIIAAIEYAEAQGAKVVNCSFGSTYNSQALRDAIAESDMLFVASVGNGRTNLEELPVYPACYGLDNLISVTSVNADGGVSYFSNYSNTLVDIAALGRDVYSALPENQYGLQSGTSMSAAFVSAAAGAAFTNEELTAAEMKERLIACGDMLSNLQNMVIDRRRLNLANVIEGIEVITVTDNYPADDFDVHGYQRTDAENWQLFSSRRVMKIAAGRDHTLALLSDGTVWAWGNNGSGQLGDGTTMLRTAPVQVNGLTGVVSIAAGEGHSFAVKNDGTLWAWGNNSYGKLGDGTTTTRTVPVQVSGLTGVMSVAAGYLHNFAVKTNGSVWAWGNNSYGQLGDGTTTNRNTPVQVSRLSGIVSVAAGRFHTVAIRGDRTVWAWGDNGIGQLGDGTTRPRTVPVQVSGLTGAMSVAAGEFYSIVVKYDGSVWTWGQNNYGQLGDGTTMTRVVPVQVSGLTGVGSVDVGDFHSVAVKTNGSVWTWGQNNFGQLGDGTTTTRIVPVQVSGLTGVGSVAVGYQHTLAVKNDGSAWAWGSNNFGQLAQNRSIFQSSIPIPVATPDPVPVSIDLSLSQSHVDIPIGSSTETVIATATVYDKNEVEIEEAEVTYSLVGNYMGVSVNSVTGIIIATSAAENGMVTVRAECGTLNTQKTLMIGSIDSVFTVQLEAGKTYNVMLNVGGITDFQDRTITVSYDPAKLQLIDLCAATKNKELAVGVLTELGITVTGVSAGEIQITCDKTIPSGKEWSGILNVITFKALSSGSTNLEVELE